VKVTISGVAVAAAAALYPPVGAEVGVSALEHPKTTVKTVKITNNCLFIV
jgi:hypothetical protein